MLVSLWLCWPALTAAVVLGELEVAGVGMEFVQTEAAKNPSVKTPLPYANERKQIWICGGVVGDTVIYSKSASRTALALAKVRAGQMFGANLLCPSLPFSVESKRVKA
jgi:hypothetical protein